MTHEYDRGRMLVLARPMKTIDKSTNSSKVCVCTFVSIQDAKRSTFYLFYERKFVVVFFTV